MILFVYTATSFLILRCDKLESRNDGTKSTFDFTGTITGVSGLVLFIHVYPPDWGVIFFGAFVYMEMHVVKAST